MNLAEFCFPVEEREVYFSSKSNFFDWKTNGIVQRSSPKLSLNHKAIIRSDNNTLISIVNKNYKLVPNKVLIDQLMEQLYRTDQKFEIEPHHSFVRDNRMRLQIKFPELTIKDDSPDGMALSLYIHNSYDMSEGIRMYWGAIRAICTNGVVFGQVLAKFYGKHTKGFNIKHLKQSLEKTYSLIPDIQERINVLDSLKVDKDFEKEFQESIGKKIYNNIALENNLNSITQLQLFHLLTNYISHRVKQEYQARYQTAASKLFKL
ncbi:DUF932 domain-containing protein [Immundisolibacter sp.]